MCPAVIFNGNAVKTLKDRIRFKTEGEFYWDTTDKCLAYPTDIPNVTNQVGQETHVRVFNNTVSTIMDGTVVYISGSNAVNFLPEITPAIANDYTKSRVLGVVTAPILAGAVGIVTRTGVVHDLNTSTYSAGAVLYLSPTSAGEFTSTSPNDGSYIIKIGHVNRVDATLGSIIVFPTVNEFTTETTQKTGWSNTYGPATISFVDGALGATRTLTITPVGSEFHFYQDGIKYSKTTDSIPIPDVEGMYIVYYNLGTLVALLNPTNTQIDTIIRNNPTVAYVYWDFTNRIHNYLGKELHDMQFAQLSHAYAHFAFGARYLEGLALSGFSADGNGSLAAHAQFGVDLGSIVDEDIYLPTGAIASTTGLPIYYLNGTTAAPTLRRATNAGFSVLTTGTGRAAYNLSSGGNWSLAEVSNGGCVIMHVFMINENDATKRAIAIVGQVNYSNIANARTGVATEIAAIQLIPAWPKEIKSLGSVIFETNNTYTNAVKSRVRTTTTGLTYTDWRAVNTTGGSVAGGASPTTFVDNLFAVYDNLDVSKQLQFQVSNVSTSTTKVVTIVNRDITMNVCGGVKIEWSNDGPVACGEETGAASFYRKAYTFMAGGTQAVYSAIKVPYDYIAGRQITLKAKIFCPTAGNATVLIQAVSTLIKNGVNALSVTTNQRTTTNTAVAIATANLEYLITLDITEAVGAINGVAIASNDTILIQLQRGTDTNTDLAYFMPSTTEVFL